MKFEQYNKQQLTDPLYPFVFVDNALNNDQIKLFDEYANKFGFTDGHTGTIDNFGVNNYLRRSKVSWLPPIELSQDILNHFKALILDINFQRYKFDLTGFEPMQYTVYEESNAGEYKWHTDTMLTQDNNVRKLSLSILLSDPSEFEGGKLLLNADGNIIVAEERKGRAYFFPSWMLHCVTPVTKGVRKSLVVWTHGPAFK